MLIFAVDLSSDTGSAAVLRDDRILAQRDWIQTRATGQHLFSVWPSLLAEANQEPADIQLFACGRGPGSFSGIRVALAALKAGALPGNVPVITLSSGEALAFDTAAREDVDRVAVVGDARRNTLWLGVFEQAPDRMAETTPWCVVQPADLADRVDQDTLLVSPQWSRLQRILPAALLDERPWVREDRPPAAAAVGHLALARYRARAPSDPATPLYLHPAVRGNEAPSRSSTDYFTK